MGKKRQYWVDFFSRFKGRKIIPVDTPEETMDFAHAYKAVTFARDITDNVGVPRPDEGVTNFAKTRLYGAQRTYRFQGVSNTNPLPTLAYSGPPLRSLSRLTLLSTPAPVAIVFTPTKTVTVKAATTNIDIIFVTGDGTAPDETLVPPVGWPLAPGDEQVFPVRDLQDIIHRSATVDQLLHILFMDDIDVATKV